MTVEPYGILTADEGLPRLSAGHCPGTGLSSKQGSSGAGHGGSGGHGQGEDEAGVGHDSYLDPSAFGCNGGHSYFPHEGGQGGGRLRLDIAEWLTVDGTISVAGGDWRSIHAGGGSGGSVFIKATILDGSGLVDVSGGSGFGGVQLPHGGGGAGGRIALYYIYNFYVGKYVMFH